MGKEPTISVIVPNYRTDEYLDRALESVHQQSGGDHEVVLVDSSGTERVERTASEYPQVEYVYQEPDGVASARNAGIDHATGEYVAFLDADDYWAENKTERQLEELRRTGAEFVYADEYIVRNGEPNRHRTLPVRKPERHYVEYFRRGSGIPIRTVMCERSCVERHRFWEELAVREDPHLWVRILSECTPCRVDEPLAYKVDRQGSLTADLDRLYDCERRAVRDLRERLPELRAVGAEREARTHYKYGKRYLLDEQPREAREALWRSASGDQTPTKSYVLLALTYLPLSPSSAKRAARGLEQLYRKLG